MVDEARMAALIDADSWRGFFVGAAALVASNNGVPGTEIVALGNRKPVENMDTVCAETRVLSAVGRRRVLGEVIAGTSDRDLIKAVTGHPTPTLHTCANCCVRFARHLQHDGPYPRLTPDMPIVTVGLYDDILELHSVEGLLRAAANGTPDIATEGIVDPGFENWRQRAYDYQDPGAWRNDFANQRAAASFIIAGQISEAS